MFFITAFVSLLMFILLYMLMLFKESQEKFIFQA